MSTAGQSPQNEQPLRSGERGDANQQIEPKPEERDEPRDDEPNEIEPSSVQRPPADS